MAKSKPKLRTVEKSIPPFGLNEFSRDFPFILGKELVYLLASKGKPILEGPEWEAIFANCIGAEWKPSNVGLDDVILGNTAWGAKTVKAKSPERQKKVRLISGRNSPVYSFGNTIDITADANDVGISVLEIWNERVSAIREKFQNLRTVVLVKSNDLTEVVVFEFDTIRYDPELFIWEWNKNGNLIGITKSTSEHRFTWQPHGSQFTIIEDIPENSLLIKIKEPEALNKENVLIALGFDRSWVKVSKKKELKFKGEY
jgi:superfamily I DNA and/or RNA helicase